VCRNSRRAAPRLCSRDTYCRRICGTCRARPPRRSSRPHGPSVATSPPPRLWWWFLGFPTEVGWTLFTRVCGVAGKRTLHGAAGLCVEAAWGVPRLPLTVASVRARTLNRYNKVRSLFLWEGSTTVRLSFTLSFGEIPRFRGEGEIRRCAWSQNAFFCMCPV